MSSQCSSMVWRARSGRPSSTARTSAACWRVGVRDVGLQHRDGTQHLVQAGLDRGDRLDHPRRAGQRGDREVEPGVGLPVPGPAGGRRRPRGAPSPSGARAGRRAVREAASAAAPGSTIRRKSRASSQSSRCAAVVRAAVAGRRALRLHRDDGAAAAPAARLDQAGRAQRGDRLPQGRPRDLHPLGELALGRQRAAQRVDARAGSRWRAARRRPRRRGDRGPGAARPRRGGAVARRSRGSVWHRRRKLSMVWVHTELRVALYDAIATGLASGQPVPFLKGCTDARIA